MTSSKSKFGRVDLAVINDQVLSARDKVLYAILSLLAWESKDSRYPFCQVTVGYLAELLNRNERSVQIALKALEERGIVLRQPQFKTIEGRKRQIASRFIVIGGHSPVYSTDQGHGFCKVPQAVLINHSLSMNEKCLFMVIRSMFDNKTDCIKTYVATIAEKMNITPSAVFKGLKALKEKDVLKITPNFVAKTRGRSASTYILGADLEGWGEILSNNVMDESSGQILRSSSSSKYTNSNFVATKDGKSEASNFDNVDNIKNPQSYRASLDEVPNAMRPVVEYLFGVTGRSVLYKKEIEALKALDAHDTPTRIREEINRVVDSFTAKNKPLTKIYFGYIYACLKAQQPTFQKYSDMGSESAKSVEHAKKVIAQDRKDEKERRRKLLEYRYQIQAQRQNNQDKALDWINPATEVLMSETEAQTTVNDLEKKLLFSETECLAKTIVAQRQQRDGTRGNSNESVPATTHVPVQHSQEIPEIISKDQVLEYLNETLIDADCDQSAEQILANSLKGLSPDETQAKLKQIWAVKTQGAVCGNCPSIANCPHHGVKQNIFPATRFKSKDFILFFGREKCEELAKVETRQKTQLRFMDAIKQSGLAPLQYSQTFAEFCTEGLSLDVLNAKATSMQVAQEGKWLMLTGKSGSGKTHLAVAIALTVIAQGKRAVYGTATEILSKLFDGFKNGTHTSVKKKYQEADCLIIDESDKERASQGATKYLTEIVNYRYAHNLQTIFVSNMSPEGLIRKNRELFEPVISRLAEKGSWLEIADAGDYRAKAS